MRCTAGQAQSNQGSSRRSRPSLPRVDISRLPPLSPYYGWRVYVSGSTPFATLRFQTVRKALGGRRRRIYRKNLGSPHKPPPNSTKEPTTRRLLTRRPSRLVARFAMASRPLQALPPKAFVRRGS